VRQGRTDAWIAHKLDVSIEQLERFKRDHDLLGEGAAPGRPADPLSVPPPEADSYLEEVEEEDEEEDEVDWTEPPDEPEPEEQTERAAAGDDGRTRRGRPERETPESDDEPRRRRRRGRRGGRRRRRPSSLEATFDHGDDGYGLWLDPAVVENPVYAEHWAGHREVVVTFDRDQITIRRAGSDADADTDDGEAEAEAEADQ
jgi:hypothetical protein